LFCSGSPSNVLFGLAGTRIRRALPLQLRMAARDQAHDRTKERLTQDGGIGWIPLIVEKATALRRARPGAGVSDEPAESQ
jgi:hypothetical protein